MIECSGCQRWVYLEETPFKSLSEAKDAHYTCRLCMKIEAVEKALLAAMRSERQERECITTELRAALQEEKAMRKAAEDKLRAAVEEEREIIKTLEEEIKTERIKRDEAEKTIAQMKRDQEKEDRSRQAGGSNTASTNNNEKGQRTTTAGNMSTQSGVSPVLQQPWIAAARKGMKRKQDGSQNSSFQDSQQRQGQTTQNTRTVRLGRPTKQVVLVGDSTVRELKAPVLDGLNWDKRVRVTALPGAKLQAILEAADGPCTQTKQDTLVIIQGGLDNIVLGEEPTQVAEAMRSTLVRWLDQSESCRVCICSVPFTKAKDPEVAANIAALNKALKQECSNLGQRVTFINSYWMLRDLPLRAMNGDHYTPEAAQAFGQSLAQRVAVFLGDRPQMMWRNMIHGPYMQPHGNQEQALQLVQTLCQLLQQQPVGPPKSRSRTFY
ncbi:unnamed protein product [Ixodes pacificus]